MAYFPGGALADRFSARRLMSVALIVSAGGGAYYATIPSLGGLKLLFAFCGLTTILLFWAGMIRATREWRGDDKQCEAFGLLNGGRGLVPALLATATVAVFAALLPSAAESATLAQRGEASRQVIWVFTGMTVAAAALVWVAAPDRGSQDVGVQDASSGLSWDGIRRVLSSPAV